jgi:two-component system OmpR family sensor kinase
MNTLFFRIFLGVGAAILLALVASVLISLRLLGGAMEQGQLDGPRELVQAAANVLSTEGEAGLRQWLESSAAGNPRMLVFVIDANGKELLGRPVPRRWLKLARRSGRPDAHRPRNFRPPRYLPRLVGPDQREYSLVFTPRRLSAVSILGWPGNRLFVLLGIVVISALMSMLLARYIARPVSRLTAATKALADGQLNTRIGPSVSSRGDELGALAKAFDTMAGRIETLVTDRENLLRDVSHELRSPLARLKLALALAQRNSPPDAQSDLARIEKESDALDGLIGQMLTLARLGDPPSSELELVRLEAVVAAVVDDARFQHGDSRIDYPPAQAYWVRGDATALRSALENVVQNAIQFSPADQPVTVILESTPGWAIVTVRDHGPGVPENQLRRIFEPLFQVDASRTPDRQGHGVGLAITARVARIYAGNVSARNVSGGGLEVRLELPLMATPGEDA